MSVHRKYISKVQPTKYNVFSIYKFYKLLYMFQAVSPLIIRGTKLYVQRQVLSIPDAVQPPSETGHAGRSRIHRFQTE